ncbi:hypothetical protein [Porphyrobacter sp. AAP60]|uniref:hypothetical protein n=1 Tax=Porphyrobacter sp. AAP60 TaxID=1523423 RepID=UPI0006B9E006|nr:hypothetical protein [Porphyrobacter sp. AAP60]KPF63083.1 hypothetical protein IP79_11045 [Porphyrobacter sp. AAP60]
MSGFVRSVSAVIIAACLVAATPALAQAAIDPELRRLAGMHAASTYALGANDTCDLFKQGELRALDVLARATGEALEVDAGPGTSDRVNRYSSGFEEWKGCPTKAAAPDAWRHIHNAKILASALIAAPAMMSRDPATCEIEGEGRAYDRKVWQIAADVKAAEYRSSARHAEFEALQSYFAGQVDDECAYGRRHSIIMQAAFDFIRQIDQGIIMRNFYAPHMPADQTIVLGPGAVPIPEEHFFWRSRRGDFVASETPVNFGVYRISGKGDKKAISAVIVPLSAGAPAGFLFISKQGKWSARLDRDVRVLSLDMGGGQFVPFDRVMPKPVAGEPTAYVFELSDANRALLDRLKASTQIGLQYQDNERRWASFAALTRNQAAEPLRMVDIRTALAWVNSPAADVGKE